MNNQKLRIARIKRMADKKFGRHKCPNCYGFLPMAALRTHWTLASPNFRKIISVKSAKSVVVLSVLIGCLHPKIIGKNIRQIREIRS